MGSSASLSSAGLDGLMSMTIHTEMGVPSDLAVDYFTGRVYWSDPVMDTIESVNETGGDHKRIVSKGK